MLQFAQIQRWSQVEVRPKPSPARGAAISLGLLVVLLTAFATSPIKTSYDSRWSLQTAMSLARGHGGDLTEFLPALQRDDFPQIDYPDGRPRSPYPIGTPLLAAPFVAVAAWADPSFENGLQNGHNDKFEKVIASTFGAIAGCVFFWAIFSQFESVPIALVTTAIFCFGTSMWSTATRALWQHGPLVLMLATAMLLLVRARTRPQLIQFVSLPLAMGYLIRPTGIVPVFAISIYVLLCHREWFVRYVAWAMTIALPWFWYNFSVYHAPVSPYYWHEAFSSTTDFTQGLLANLFSPSRGLFIFSPVLIFAVTGFAVALRDRQQRPLNIAFAGIIVGHTIIIGAASMWWAGHSFGPRFMTDIVPFLAYFTAFNFRLPVGVAPAIRAALVSCIGLSALISIVINAQGALRSAPMPWNVLPRNIDLDPSRVWDWSDPQFARTKAANARMLQQIGNDGRRTNSD